ncbi:MAG: pyrroline-5-carboxylate reductase family protein [Dorea sp.]
MYGRRNEIIDGNSGKYRKSMETAQADSLKLLSLHTVHFINICSKTSHDQTRRNYYDHKKIGIIGCGNMGGAILYGALESGVLDKENVYVYDIKPACVVL